MECEQNIIKMVVDIYFSIFFPILVTISNVAGFEKSNGTETNKTFVCEREHKYDRLDIREIMGKWKALELYMHLSNEGVVEYQSCPMVTIWESAEFPRSTFGPSTENQLFHVQHMNARFRHEYRHLRLLWDEAGHTIEYALYFRNDSAGYWQILDGQNGTLPARPNYQQFSGTIQVLKAVNDHLVLNFCQEPIQGRSAQLYSVLFSREPGRMARWEIESVHSMLQNKKLSVASRRMVCGNSADRPLISFVLSSVMSVVILVLSSS